MNPIKQKAARIRWAKHPWVPIADKATLEELYIQKGMTQREIATAFGTSSKPVETAMRYFRIPRRKAVPRCQAGHLNPAWKGDRAGYCAMHLRVIQQKGQPNLCEVCGENRPSKTYEWASQTGQHAKISDYKRMCCSCHRKYDNARRRNQNT